MARKLAHQALKLVGKNWGKASLTVKKNRQTIRLFADRVERAFGLERIQDLKPKHVERVFNDLLSEGKKPTTMAAYATAARTIAEAINKKNIVPRTNAELGFSRKDERYCPVDANLTALQEVRSKLYALNEWQGLAHDMRMHFGLRAKESLLSTEMIIENEQLYLVVKGAKGGRPRAVPVLSPEQKETLARVHDFLFRSGLKSLVPANLNLKQGYDKQRNDLHRLGATKVLRAHAHALRHHYIQMKKAQGVDDMDLVKEVGHGRVEVLEHYCSAE